MLTLSGLFGRLHPAYEEGEQLLEQEKFVEAETCFLTAISDMKARSVPARRQTKVLVALAKSQWKQAKLEQARETAQAAHQILKGTDKATTDLAMCLNILGSVCEDEEDPESATPHYREALDVLEKVIPIEAVALTEQCRKLAAHLQKLGNLGEAKELYQRAVETAEKRLGTSAPMTADCLMDLGRCQVAAGEEKDGIASMERAVEIHRETLGATSEEVARDLVCVAAACQKSGDLHGAVKFYELALKVRERQLGGNAEDFAEVLLGLADAQSLLGNHAPAISLLQQATTKLEGCNSSRLGKALEDLADGYMRWGRYEDAVACYQKARVVWQKDPEANQDRLEMNAAMIEDAMVMVPIAPAVEMPVEQPGGPDDMQSILLPAPAVPVMARGAAAGAGASYPRYAAGRGPAPTYPTVAAAAGPVQSPAPGPKTAVPGAFPGTVFAGAPGGNPPIVPAGIGFEGTMQPLMQAPVMQAPPMNAGMTMGRAASSAAETVDDSELNGWDELSFDLLARVAS